MHILRKMKCPPQVQKAMEHIHLEIGTLQHNQLVSTWLDWLVAQQMQQEDKWIEPPAKRQRSLVAELPLSIAK